MARLSMAEVWDPLLLLLLLFFLLGAWPSDKKLVMYTWRVSVRLYAVRQPRSRNQRFTCLSATVFDQRSTMSMNWLACWCILAQHRRAITIPISANEPDNGK